MGDIFPRNYNNRSKTHSWMRCHGSGFDPEIIRHMASTPKPLQVGSALVTKMENSEWRQNLRAEVAAKEREQMEKKGAVPAE